MALTAKQKQFCEHYIISLNAADAARRAGYSAATAKEIGSENLTKPNIREFIDKRLGEVSLTATETIKLISDTAKGNLSDYYVVKKVLHTPMIEVPLIQVIKHRKEVIEFEREYADRVTMNEKQLERHYEEQDRRKDEVIRLELELERNPKATRIIEGPTVWIDHAELDMVKLIQDKEKGKIKSVTPGPNGVKVELVGADGSFDKLMKIHGLSKEVSKIALTDTKGDDVQFTLSKLTDAELKQLIELQSKSRVSPQGLS